MKKLKEIANNMQHIIKLIQIMIEYDSKYFKYILADIMAYSAISLVNLFLVQQSVTILEKGEKFGTFAMTIMGLLLANMFLNCLHSYFNYKRDVHGSTISVALMKSIFEKTLCINYELLLDKEIQDKRYLAAKITENGRFVTLSNVFYALVANSIVLIGYITILAQIDIWILIISLAVVLANTIVMMHQNKFRRAIDVDLGPTNRKIIYFNEIGRDFSYSKEIKNYRMINALVNKFIEVQKEWHQGCNKVTRNSLSGYNILYVTNFILNGVVYLYLGFRVLVQNILSIADFSMFLAAILDFNGCIQAIVRSCVEVSSNAPYLQDYLDFMQLQTMNDKKNGELVNLPETNTYRFTFENVSYKYPHQESYVLRNISFDTKPGEKLAIVGENGAGKTTMVLLFMRFIDPTEGRILLNGIDICTYDENEYRTLFSSVFQDFKLFSFTVEENITALAECNSKKLETVIDSSGLLQKIQSLGKGIKTYIDKLYDSEGVSFSGGEGQRLAIARALYKDAPIYVLDEPTAALDPRIENEIYTKFRIITKKKATFYITHRLASTHFCDRIIVLRNGRIEEIGTHRELIKKKGYYAELYNMQAQYYMEKD